MTKFDSAAFVICCCVTVTLKKGVARLIKALAIYVYYIVFYGYMITEIKIELNNLYKLITNFTSYWTKRDFSTTESLFVFFKSLVHLICTFDLEQNVKIKILVPEGSMVKLTINTDL